VLAEPSAAFCAWARRLLLGEDSTGGFPCPALSCGPTTGRSNPPACPSRFRRRSSTKSPRRMYPGQRATSTFVTCANVLDRVDDPAALVGELRHCCDRAAFLVIASPLHFDEH